MKKLIAAAILFSALFAGAQTASADVYVNRYRNQNGNYVQPHHRTYPDGNPNNNYSHRGNYNPWTCLLYTSRKKRNSIRTSTTKCSGRANSKTMKMNKKQEIENRKGLRE